MADPSTRVLALIQHMDWHQNNSVPMDNSLTVRRLENLLDVATYFVVAAKIGGAFTHRATFAKLQTAKQLCC